MQIESRDKWKTKFSRLALPRCRLSYPKIVQIESRDKWKTKFSRLALPRCRLSSAKKCKSRAVQKNGCLKCTAEVTEKTFCRIGPGSYRPVRVSSLQIDKYRLAIRRFRSCYLLYNRFPGKNIEINSAFKKKNKSLVVLLHRKTYICRKYHKPKLKVIMNKAELINAISEKANITKTEAKNALDATLEAIAEAMAQNDKVALIGFGTFSVSEKGERTGINPATKEKITIPAKKVVKFKPGAELSAKVN